MVQDPRLFLMVRVYLTVSAGGHVDAPALQSFPLPSSFACEPSNSSPSFDCRRLFVLRHHHSRECVSSGQIMHQSQSTQPKRVGAVGVLVGAARHTVLARQTRGTRGAVFRGPVPGLSEAP